MRAPMLRRGPALFRSAALRLAGFYVVVFGLSALAMIAFLWWATAGLLDRQVEVAIRADAQGLAERLEEGGVGALVATVRDRIAENVDDDAIYLVVDARGTPVAGNLDHWPEGVTSPDVWYELAVLRAGMRSLARVHRYDLPGGYRLLVGRDVRTRAQLRSVLTDALFWTILIVAVLGVVGALLLQGVFRRMLADVSATADAVAAGDLSRRVRVTGHGDEFDRLAETINDMLDRTLLLMDAVRQVSNAIAHDLRTPIARARARLEDAAGREDSELLRAAIERAVGDLDGVVAVFEALLRIAEIEAGARRSAFAEVDLAPLLEDLGELYGAVAEEKGLRLSVQAPPVAVTGDREMLQQAVANLLDNAVKFSPPDAEIGLAAGQEGRQAWIRVTDRGPGIPAADRERATERFYRGESARHTPGSGLGLALVQAVAHLHGGVLRLEDNDPGLRAELVLPLQHA